MVTRMVLVSLMFMTILFLCLTDGKTNRVTWKECVIAAAGFTLLMFAFMHYTGVLQSGYHFVDDHETYTIGRDLKDLGFWRTMHKWISDDMHARFRFTYFLIRVTQCYFLGDSFIMWHIVQTFMAALGLFLCYLFARRMNCSVWSAYIFAVIIYIGGGQSAVWWRLGPQENWGIILLMLTLLSLLNYAENKTRRNWLTCIIATILLGGIKEAFLLLLPLLPIWLAARKLAAAGRKLSVQNVWMSMKEYGCYFLTAYFVFLLNIGIIILYVGTHAIGYAGIDDSYGITDYIRLIGGIVTGRIGLYLKLTVIGGVFLLLPVCVLLVREKKGYKDFFSQMLFPLFLFGYILTTQFVLYARSGMYERYILPTTFAFSYFWLIDMRYIAAKYRTLMKGSYYMFIVFMALALFRGVDDENRAAAYAEDGKNTTALLSKAAACAAGNKNIIVGIGYEQDISASVYLQEKYDIQSVYNLFYLPRENDRAQDGYIRDENEKQSIVLSEGQIFMGYPDLLVPVMEEAGILANDFDTYQFGEYVLYVKEGR